MELRLPSVESFSSPYCCANNEIIIQKRDMLYQIFNQSLMILLSIILLLMANKQKIDKALSLVPHAASATSFLKYVIHSDANKEKLIEQIKNCRIDQTKIRFNVWRMLLGVYSINNSLQQKIQEVNSQRKTFKEKRDEAFNNGSSPQKKQNPVPKNPLIKAIAKAPKAIQSDDGFLKDQIRKDVQRTYQQLQFFQEDYILKLLSNVLFVWCKRNPDVSYKQGMNEVLASIVYVYFQQVYVPQKNPEGFDDLNDQNKKAYVLFNSPEYAQADIFGVFEKVMNIQHQMYKTQTDTNLKGVINPNSKNNTPILQRIITIIDQKLKALDIELFRTIKLQDVQTKSFLLRWIRCMHTREFSLQNSFLIWDSIFLDYYESPLSKQKCQFQFIDAMCVAMFIYMRSQALSRETSYQILQIYQKYPNLKKGGYLQQLISLAWSLCQALRQPPKQSSDWIGEQSSKKDSKLQFLKTRQSPVAKIQPKQQEQPANKVKQALKVTEKPKQQPKQIKKQYVTQKPKTKNEPLEEKKQKTKLNEGEQEKQVIPEFDFSITLQSLQWQTLVQKLQKSLTLNTDEESRNYVLEGIQMLRAKVESITLKKQNQ